MSRLADAQPLLWRDSRLPHVELRVVSDGREVCYAPHSHTQWSMGAITSGRSTFEYVGRHYEVGAGSLVFMNPEWVHACNPVNNQPWGYLMLTPHAYQINRRVQLGQKAIRQGAPIADAAIAAGFFDQPHFQRVFKRLVAATPGQYVRPSKQTPNQV